MKLALWDSKWDATQLLDDSIFVPRDGDDDDDVIDDDYYDDDGYDDDADADGALKLLTDSTFIEVMMLMSNDNNSR